MPNFIGIKRLWKTVKARYVSRIGYYKVSEEGYRNSELVEKLLDDVTNEHARHCAELGWQAINKDKLNISLDNQRSCQDILDLS